MASLYEQYEKESQGGGKSLYDQFTAEQPKARRPGEKPRGFRTPEQIRRLNQADTSEARDEMAADEATTRGKVLGTMAAPLSEVPGGKAVESFVAGVGRGGYRRGFGDVEGAIDSAPAAARIPAKIVGGVASIPLFGGSAAAQGFKYGATSGLLEADPDAGPVRRVLDAAIQGTLGAGAGKAAEYLPTMGKAVVSRFKGETPKANLLARRTARNEASGPLYDEFRALGNLDPTEEAAAAAAAKVADMEARAGQKALPGPGQSTVAKKDLASDLAEEIKIQQMGEGTAPAGLSQAERQAEKLRVDLAKSGASYDPEAVMVTPKPRAVPDEIAPTLETAAKRDYTDVLPEVEPFPGKVIDTPPPAPGQPDLRRDMQADFTVDRPVKLRGTNDAGVQRPAIEAKATVAEAAPDPVQPLRDILQNDVIQLALDRVKKSPDLADLPATDARVLDAIYKIVGDRTFKVDGKIADAVANDVRVALRDAIESAAQAKGGSYAKALDEYAKGSRGMKAVRRGAEGLRQTIRPGGGNLSDKSLDMAVEGLPAWAARASQGERQAAAEGVVNELGTRNVFASIPVPAMQGWRMPLPGVPSNASREATALLRQIGGRSRIQDILQALAVGSTPTR